MSLVGSHLGELAPRRRSAVNVDESQVVVGGVPLTTLSRFELAERILADCHVARQKKSPPRLLFDLNGQGLSMQETDAEYRHVLSRADLVHADGGFLVSIARTLGGKPIAERSATTDMIADIAERAVVEGLSFYLLGGSEELNAKCAEMLQQRYPGLKIAGRHNGYFTIEEEASVVASIKAAKPDIIWVGMGKPREQTFCLRYRHQLRAGWMITCGGCFNFITGDYKRAPVWMQKSNLEWVHRMVTNPRQLFWRYVVTTPHALYLAMSRTPLGQGDSSPRDDA